MLFNSYEFIFLFLPLTAVIFYGLRRHSTFNAALTWLTLSSLFFYGWWNPAYLILLVTSIGVNFLLGNTINRNPGKTGKYVLYAGIVFNLSLIGYYKYAYFLTETANYVAGTNFHLETIILPLAISFFTFQQITYLVDSRAGLTREYSFLQYCLFVSFFPQLIAGPIVHHGEMMPQFQRLEERQKLAENLAVGLTIFSIGLFKKAVIADGVAPYGTSVFADAEAGVAIDFFRAWGGALSYTMQLYFDFSGYSDMAIGAARMFGIVLPLNFNSPYKAASIIDFWQRWHMTLSRFLRDYLYIPLGGNRKGPARRYINIFLTMLLGGLWHGAGWTFVIWGGLHGLYIIINHVWRALRRNAGPPRFPRIAGGAGRALTLIAVIFGWVFFRAESLDAALALVESMIGLNGAALPLAIAYRAGPLVPFLEATGIMFTQISGAQFMETWMWIIALVPLALFTPNTQQILGNFAPALDFRADRTSHQLRWMPSRRWVCAVIVLLSIGVLSLPQVSEFLYFQF
ncbi:MAG: MBOAT family protein [Alphaproteobacteria bacterium]